MNRFLSIKSRLLIFSLCISLIPIAVTTTIYYLYTRNALKYRILEDLRAIAESREQHVLSFMERTEIRTADFSTDGFIRRCFETIIRGGNSKQDAVVRLNKYLSKKKLPLNRHLMAIALVDKNGRVVSSTDERLIGKDFSSQDVFLQGIRKNYGETYCGQLHYSSDLDTNCTFVSAPIIARHGVETLGVIINIYSLSALTEITTNRVGMGDTGEVYLVGKDKLMLTQSRFFGNAVHKQVVNTEPVRKLIEEGTTTIGIYQDYRGKPVVGVSVYLPKYGWTLLAEIDKAEAFSPLKKLGLVALFFGVVSAVAVTGLGISFAASTSDPIRDLKDAAEKFAGGDLDYRVKTTRNDEIGALSESFNVMAVKLKGEIAGHKRAEEALKALNNSLEQRIAERTAALVKANKELKTEIAERRRVEGELRKLFNAVEQSSCSVVITDREGNIEYVNPKFSRVTGYAPEEVIGQNPRILKSGEKPSEEYKSLWDTITSGGEWEGEFHNKKKNGELYWEYASISPIRNPEGAITHFVAIKEDITERKRTEEELRKHRDRLEYLTNRLATANKELEAFCYSVSHDLRAPLRAIDGFSRALLEDYSDRLDSQGKNYLQRVCAASKYMGQLIDNLLNLSRITRGELSCKKVNLSALAKAIASELQEAEPGRQAEFIIAEKLVVNGDPHLLQIALKNLLDNAWKFTRKRPRAIIELGVKQHNGKPVYFVHDNGAGFDMAYVNKLFGAFQRLHSPTEFEGTGIGLATVQRIIHRHGGQIWAEGAVDQGATFYFTI
ncbi:MAG: PAS domain S-box protein [Candidatus Brocadia sp.]|jgi:PAS domain S-box-containing protein